MGRGKRGQAHGSIVSSIGMHISGKYNSNRMGAKDGSTFSNMNKLRVSTLLENKSNRVKLGGESRVRKVTHKCAFMSGEKTCFLGSSCLYTNGMGFFSWLGRFKRKCITVFLI